MLTKSIKLPKKLLNNFYVTWTASNIPGDRSDCHNTLIKAKTSLDAWRKFKKENKGKNPIGCIQTYLPV